MRPVPHAEPQAEKAATWDVEVRERLDSTAGTIDKIRKVFQVALFAEAYSYMVNNM